MKIHFASDLQQRLLSLKVDQAQLVADIEKWKSGPGERQTEVFGRDVANIGSKYVRHVHMVPVNEADKLAVWQTTHAKNKKHNSNQHQLSDRYLIYADGGRYGYLIIDIINDPGGHEIWAPKLRPSATSGKKLLRISFASAKFHNHVQFPASVLARRRHPLVDQTLPE